MAVNGIEAIELTSRPGSPISETIWVSPDTYLPVRVVIRSAFGPAEVEQTANIAWLPPTAQNLAELTVPIPAGFRQVPVFQVVMPILRQSLGKLLPKFQSPCPASAGSGCEAGPSAFGSERAG